jgi:CrcB protein
VTDARTPRAAHLVRDRWDILLVIAAGGALGSLGRWAVSFAVPHEPGQVPWSTWLENVSGAFLLGVLMVLVLDFWPPSRYVRPFLGVGVLGGYTTFSTYMLDTRTLLAAGRAPAAAGYLLGTLVAGLLAAVVGVVVARSGVRTVERRRRKRAARDRDHERDETVRTER